MKEKSFKILKYFNIFLIIISIIAILFLHNFKINKLKIIYETLIKNGDYKIYLKKENNEKLTTNDIEKINTDYRKIIKMTESNHQITLLSGDNNDKVYYNLFADKTLKFIEYTNNDFENINIIGKLPTKPNEVLIHKILADYIIENGILIKNSKKLDNIDIYNPKSYEELINSKKQINFGNSMNSYIIITGIIDDDLSKYNKLKSLSNNEIKNDNKLYKIYKEFQNNYENIINIAYINNNFFNKFEINFLDNINYTSTLNYNNEKFYLKLGYLQDYDEVEIYDGSEYKTTLDLKDNEIIIDLNFLNILTKGELLKEWNNIKENTSLKDYIAKFSNENNIIGTKAKIEVEKIPKLNNKEVIIKGIRIANLDLDKYFTSSEIYIKKELINKYINKIEITELIIDAKNKYELTNLFKNNLKDTNYIIKTKYDNKIDSVYSKKVNIKNKLEIFSKTILIIGIILLIISIYIENKKHKKI